MWIVQLALHRPYTFVVFSILVVIFGAAAAIVTPKDIFPYINIPVVSVVWSYTGLTPDDMEKRVVTICERAMTTTVNDIEHMESQSYSGVAVVRVFFQPNVKVELALAQITAIVQTILRVLPPGTFPPNILKYDASSVPILQLGLSGEGLSEQDLYDLGLNFIRTRLATVQGASVPLPYGGKTRQIMVDLDPAALYAKHLSATDISNAMNAQNLILPAGTARVGEREYLVRMNSSPPDVSALNDMPVRASNGAIVYIKDVGAGAQWVCGANECRAPGRPARFAPDRIEKWQSVDARHRRKDQSRAAPSKGGSASGPADHAPFRPIYLRPHVDQRSTPGGTIAAVLTALMILLFLGSWRSTLIVCVSIPLSILTSICILAALGETINVMTLGGLALAVGILVDDATVEIENTHRNLGEGEHKSLVHAILDSASQVAAPALVSTLSICIVFLPVVLLTGAAKYLFTPLAMAVVFAMMASYFLSRTLVPTMMHYLLPAEVPLYQSGEHEHLDNREAQNWVWRVHERFNIRFERLRHRYHDWLAWSLHHRVLVLIVFGIFVLGSSPLTVCRGT